MLSTGRLLAISLARIYVKLRRRQKNALGILEHSLAIPAGITVS